MSRRLNQKVITEKLQLHQSTISRMLKKASEINLVRFNISTPPGTFAELEDQLSSQFDLKDVVVVDCPGRRRSPGPRFGHGIGLFS